MGSTKIQSINILAASQKKMALSHFTTKSKTGNMHVLYAKCCEMNAHDDVKSNESKKSYISTKTFILYSLNKWISNVIFVTF